MCVLWLSAARFLCMHLCCMGGFLFSESPTVHSSSFRTLHVEKNKRARTQFKQFSRAHTQSTFTRAHYYAERPRRRRAGKDCTRAHRRVMTSKVYHKLLGGGGGAQSTSRPPRAKRNRRTHVLYSIRFAVVLPTHTLYIYRNASFRCTHARTHLRINDVSFMMMNNGPATATYSETAETCAQ